MFKSDRIVALDIGASKLVLAQFKAMRSGGLELVNYAVAPIGLDPELVTESSAYVVSAIRDMMRKSNIHPGQVSMSISGQMVIPKYVKLPPVPREKIAQVVKFEAQNNVPFPIDEVVWDYQLLGEEDGQLSVMIVAVKEELVQKTTDCVTAAGLDPDIVDVSPLALYNAVRYNYSDLQGCTMILDMGARSTNVVFVEGNRFFNRSIPVAGNAITRELMKEFELSFEDAEELKLAHAFVGFGGTYEASETGVAERTSKIVRSVMTRLHAEISRTINFYRSQQGGSQPALVLLAGGSSVIQHTNTFLRDKLKVDVDYLNPFRNAAVSESISAEQIGHDLHLLGEVVGVALRKIHTCPVEINLMPHEMVRRKTFENRLPFFGVAAAALILTALVWLGYLQRLCLTTAENRLHHVEARVASLGAAEHAVDQLATQQKTVYAHAGSLVDLLRKRTEWLEIIETMHSRVLPGMWLTSFKPISKEENGQTTPYLEIMGLGFADQVKLEGVSEFAASLKGQGYFGDNILVRKVKPVQGTDYVIEFLIEAALKQPAAAK